MRLGVCYYPEHWPRARWAPDARRFAQAGLDVVRFAEFAWSELEPAPGRFAWDWLDRAIEVFVDEGFDVVLGTPTAAPPAWLSQADPTTLPVDAEGRRRRPGGRRHYCPSSPAYHEHTRRIVGALAERYGGHPRVIGWQVDNEFGGGRTARCHCELCEAGFRAWLHARYGSLNALNAAWGTVFWSATFDAWEEVRAPILSLATPNPSHVLDYWRFASDTLVAYARLQVEELRARLPEGRWVTHNFMGLYPDLDGFALAAPLDLVSWDSYPTGNLHRWRDTLYGDDPPDAPYAFDVGDPAVTGFAHDFTFGQLARPFWVMEQQAGQISWALENTLVRPGTVRLWGWHAAASGADGLVFFRERAALSGQEQYHSGLLGWDGEPDLGLREAERLHGEAEALTRLTAQAPRAEVALLLSFADLWALQLQPHTRRFTYLRHLFVFYRALQRLGVPVAVVAPERPLEGFRLVLAPTLHLADDALAARLAALASAGATVLLGVRSGVKDHANRVVGAPLPGPFAELVGATVAAWGALPDGVPAGVASPLAGVAGPARVWLEALEPVAAETLASYDEGPFAGRPALVSRAVDRGRALYCGWLPTVAQAGALLGRLAEDLGIERLAELPPGLVACRRGAQLVLLNFTNEPLEGMVAGRRLPVGPRDVVLVEGYGSGPNGKPPS